MPLKIIAPVRTKKRQLAGDPSLRQRPSGRCLCVARQQPPRARAALGRRTGVAATVGRIFIFDDIVRADDAPQRADEDTFAFLNRVDDVYFARVRDTIEEWFAHVPADEQASLRGRLRANAEAQSAPAFWELCLRELLRRTGFAVTHEPKRAHRRPDFHARGRATSFYLEARHTGAPAPRQARDKLVRQITDQLKRVESPDFRLQFDVRRYGATLPPLARVRRAVEKWLSEVDYDAAVRAALAREPLPERTIDSGEWTFWFRVMPRRPEARGLWPRAGAIGIGPINRTGGSAAPRLAAALEQKAGYYGDLDEPFVIALDCGDTFVDWDDIFDALYGEPAFALGDDGSATAFRQPTGLFSARGHPRVSAVLTIRALRVWRLREAVPVLWPNPNAALPLEAELPWAGLGRLAADGEIVVDEPVVNPGDFLGLPPEWPGPERPLRVRASSAVA